MRDKGVGLYCRDFIDVRPIVGWRVVGDVGWMKRGLMGTMGWLQGRKQGYENWEERGVGIGVQDEHVGSVACKLQEWWLTWLLI